MTQLRPSNVGKWIQGGRKYCSGTWSVMNAIVFAGDFSVYWAALQPEWRKAGNLPAKSRAPGTFWPPLRDDSRTDGWDHFCDRAGENGFFNVVMSLYLWALATPFDNKPDWLIAVSDVAWVLSRLLQIYASKPYVKRACLPNEKVGAPSSKKVCNLISFHII